MFFLKFVHICHLYCTMSRSFFSNTVYKRYASNEPNSNDTCRNLVGFVCGQLMAPTENCQQ